MQVVRKSPSGRLFTKGVGIFGALGKGGLNDSKHFEEVSYNGMKNVTSLAAGWGHSAAITVDSEVLVFGRPYDFQSIMRLNSLYGLYKPMGRFVSNLTPKFGGDLSGVFEVPSVVSSSEKVKKCVVSAGLTSMLTESGDVLMFGQNRWGQCAVDNKQSIHVYDPTKVSLPAPVVNVDVGLQHCVAVCSTGHVYSWGKGGKGQLGNGDFESTFNPVLLTDQSLFNAKIKSVSAGFNHSVALSESGVVFVWGKGMSQELKPQKSKLVKLDVYGDLCLPRRIELPDGRRVVEITCSNTGVIMRADDSTLWAIGIGEYDRNGISEPIPVQAEVEEYDFENPPPFEMAIVEPDTKLIKGHNRVGVLKSCGKFSEIVLHEREAYVQPILDQEFFAGLPEKGKMIDISIGWQHVLVAWQD